MVGSGPLHEGKSTCIEALGCSQAAMGGTAFEGEMCYINVCEGSSTAINNVTNCGFNNCPQDCPGAGCGACVAKACQPEFEACMVATCGN